jgi:actin-like ATPase involved in cell morphogenesis
MKNLRLMLKDRYKLAVGELTLEELKRKIVKISKTKVKISGRSYETGKKKTIEVLICELWKR